MRYVLDSAVLVIEPAVHFFKDVPFIFLELTQRVRFDLLDFVSLSLQLFAEFLDKLSLLLESFLLLNDYSFFNLSAFFYQVV